jgi:N-acetylglutamate synthase-like GNAT family acetyltransferase
MAAMGLEAWICSAADLWYEWAMRRVRIRPAAGHEAADLTELAVRSKGHWGYDAAFLTACRDELTVSPADCDGSRVMVAEQNHTVVGFYQLTGESPTGELVALFVDPAAIGSGLGRRLLRHALDRARELGMSSVIIDADPYAEPFYVRAGARRIGAVASGSIEGRVLPQLEMTVPAHTG